MYKRDSKEELERQQRWHDKSFWIFLIVLVVAVSTCSGSGT